MQEKETINNAESEDFDLIPPNGRIIALDLGTKRVGVAVSDEGRNISTPLPRIARTSWKNLLNEVGTILEEFDAKALVIGLPLESDGTESEMSFIARDSARKFHLSLQVPVYLQDERVTSYDAKRNLWQSGVKPEITPQKVDSEAAAIILTDFLDRLSTK